MMIRGFSGSGVAIVNGKSAVAINGQKRWRPKIGENLLDSYEGRNAVLNDLFETDPADFRSKDVAVLNMLCPLKLKALMISTSANALHDWTV